jgi:hypothetical protein
LHGRADASDFHQPRSGRKSEARIDAERAAVAGGQLLHRLLPGASPGGANGGGAKVAAQQQRGRRSENRAVDVVGLGLADMPVWRFSTSEAGPPSATATTGTPLAPASSTICP